jgi:hypothetical protein
MPLARITTPLPEYYERLAQDLRARGFDVETATHGQFHSTGADLEITVKQCGMEDVSRLMANASSSKDMCVLVTPSGREGGIRSVELIVLQPSEAARTAPARVTPAQVIEISSSLLGPTPAAVAPKPVVCEESSQNWPKVKVAAASSWDEVSKTTNHWLESAADGCKKGVKSAGKAALPIGKFLREVATETAALPKQLFAAALRRSRTAKRVAEENEQLVPSMFAFSAEDSEVPPRQSTTEDQASPKQPEVRLLKPVLAAGVVALAVLLTVVIRQRSSQAAPIANQSVTESKNVTPAPVLKPSAMVSKEASKPVPAKLVVAKQLSHSESGAEENEITVRHIRPPASKAQVGHSQVKRYSDLD